MDLRKFGVRLEGSNIVVPREAGQPLTGFFATRFVEAANDEDAARRAVEVVHQELAHILSADEVLRVSIKIEEVWEDPQQFDDYAPGRGFTWY